MKIDHPDKMVQATLSEIMRDVGYSVIKMQGVSQTFELIVDADYQTLIYLPGVPDSGPVDWLRDVAKRPHQWAAWDISKMNGREILALQIELSRNVVNKVRDEILAELS